MIQTILSIAVALGILITFHEFGHYYIARRCGVKVLRFSVGFGKPIYTYVNNQGTEFTLAMIPLGGYVRMLDEREGDVIETEKHLAFNQKSVFQRFSIVAAGPIANFILAAFFYFCVALLGVQSLSPIVGSIVPDSPVSTIQIEEGDEIIKINGQVTRSWTEINLALASLIGQSGPIYVEYLNTATNRTYTEQVYLDEWLKGGEISNLVSSFGFLPRRPVIPLIIDQVIDSGAGQRAGILVGDQIVEVNSQSIENWLDFVNVVQISPNIDIQLQLIREGNEISLTLRPDTKETKQGIVGYVGLAAKPVKLSEDWYRTVEYSPWSAMQYGVQQTWSMIGLTFSSVVKMVKGLISIDNLSGPITIAKVASSSADSGIQSFLTFLAYLSVSLGVLNLLPIPMLDGGHLLFFSIEAIRKKPVSERFQLIAYKLGAFLLFTLMAVAIFNDIARL
ncbi:RIP metalloprotease RseP [Marinomonas sp. 15G1-11]|uniref:Zinc metalloprotease n=1 Tax=Marinomonas phaeophyticola TaxID=3004091 RepID=A0ABT4JTH2_9GAMM|nr:RIP metalloprotease RseP [Marinomonas sp. 15G1-11]MCZ2721707.1 RIP metalloprotease RseP [Marinomonas sp. 15G1-11]